MKQLSPIGAQHLLQLFDKQIITAEELMPYFVKDGKINMDPNLLTDLRHNSFSTFQNIPGYESTPTLDVMNARQVALQLHDKQLVTSEQIREFFGMNSPEGCGCACGCPIPPTITINGEG